MSVDERSKFIKKNGLCFNCFSKAHSFSSCSSKHNCFTCGKRHNTLVHYPSSQHNQFNKRTQNYSFKSNAVKSYNTNTYAVSIQCTPSTNLPSTSQNIHSCFAYISVGVLLGTALVQIVHLGTFYRVRALVLKGRSSPKNCSIFFGVLLKPFRHKFAG